MCAMGRKTIVTGRTAVVTGAASGIGRALTTRLAAAGSPVVACDWDEDGLAQTADLAGGTVLARKLDVRDRQGWMALAADVQEWAPEPIGMVVNNAGVTVSQSALNASPEDDDWVLDINFYGVLHGTRAFLPVLREQDAGAIVNVSSVFGLIGWPTQSAYCASKFAVRGYTEALRHELRGTGVRAVTVHPGGIATNIVKNSRHHEDDQGRTDKAELEKDFAKVARTSPDKAARTIVNGVERGKDRILVGPDAWLTCWLSRAAPVRYFDVIKALEPVVRR